MSVERKKDACRILFGRLCEKYGVRHWDLRFDGRGLRISAYADISNKVVRISKRFLRCANKEQLREIVLHEFAHVLAPHDRRHGKDWRKACLKIGLKSDTYKHSPLSGRTKVSCNSCGKTRYLFAPARRSRCRTCRSHDVNVTNYSLQSIRAAEDSRAKDTATEFADSLELDPPESESESRAGSWWG